MIPAVAAKDSKKPGSCRSPGRHRSSASPASASAFITCDSRSSNTLNSSSSPMTVARSTDGCVPTTRANPMSTRLATTAVARRGMPAMPSAANTDDASRATLKRDTASR